MSEDIDPGLLDGRIPPDGETQSAQTSTRTYHPHIIDLESELEDESDDSKAENEVDSAETGPDIEASDAESTKTAKKTEPEESDSEGSEPETDDEYTNETLSSTITREIQEGTYTCLVCTSEIDQHSKVWSCRSCYRVYDLDCIKDWAIRGSSTDKSSKNWRCPSCNIATNKIPSRFTCWCGRVTNPSTNPLVPFSCGNSCTYKYESCIHSCTSSCHPGAHPICGAMGPVMKCQCGKHQKQLPCLITPYETGWQCAEECSTVLCDLGHTCPKGCHHDFCGLCQETVSVPCYCGQEVLEVKCHQKDMVVCSRSEGQRETTAAELEAQDKWLGGTACDRTTRLYYDCQIHYEDLACQPLPQTTPVCKLAPSQVTTCYCGSVTLDGSDRTKCTDPVPECDSVCGKELPCGCTCLLKCHPGECECHNYFETKCACGHEMFRVPCKFVSEGGVPRCRHKCQVLLNCRKHYHRAVCCSYEQVAMERERTNKKAVRNNLRSHFQDDLMSIEPVHICTRPCNRLKSCGKHQCEALCHSGPCGVCLESSNEDLVCHCGKTRIEAPVRCGTTLVCHEQCVRPKACGHRREIHECHDDSVSCPKCTMLVTKECNCGLSSDVPGVMCSQENVSCGNICQVSKSCGHPCLRSCNAKCTKENIHDSSQVCRAQCNKLRHSCPHTCKLKCHANKPGRSKDCDVTRCTEQVSISCECGRIQSKVACGSTRDEPSRIGTILECDKQCHQELRDKELREAFSFTSLDANKISGQDFIYTDSIFETYEKQSVWCTRVEEQIRNFVEDYNAQLELGAKAPKRTYHFPSMTSPQRAYIHQLADAYNLYSESQDPEPKRSVFIVITRLTKVPVYSVSEALSLRREAMLQASREEHAARTAADSARFNALVIQDVFFGISRDELERALSDAIAKSGLENTKISWIKDSTFIFYSDPIYKDGSEEYEHCLRSLSGIFRTILRDKSLAFDCKLCFTDREATLILKIETKESKPVQEPALAVDNNAYAVLKDQDSEDESNQDEPSQELDA